MDTHLNYPSLNVVPEPPPCSGSCGKWLVVDDDPLIRSVIAMILEDHLNAAVIECDSGDLAWAAWQRLPGIEGVVTDRNMPGMDGLELAERIRAEDPNVPILIVTACPEELDPERVRKCRVGRVIGKPFSCEELASAVHTSHGIPSWLAAA